MKKTFQIDNNYGIISNFEPNKIGIDLEKISSFYLWDVRDAIGLYIIVDGQEFHYTLYEYNVSKDLKTRELKKTYKNNEDLYYFLVDYFNKS